MNTKILTDKIKDTEEYKCLFSRLSELKESGEVLPLLVNGMCDGAEYALCVSLVKEIKERFGKTVLVVTAEQRDANKLNSFLQSAGIKSGFYPMRDFNFYDMTSSHELEYERIGILIGTVFSTLDAVVTTPDALLQYTMPKKTLIDRTFQIDSDTSSLSVHEFSQKLCDTGYTPCELVESPGQFAVRGGIIDVFPTGGEFRTDNKIRKQTLPIRIELFGDEIDRMEIFDPSTQRMVEKISSFSITPSKEIIASKEQCFEIRDEITSLLENEISPDTKKELEKELFSLDNGINLSFFDKFISLIYPEKECLLDYFMNGNVAVISDIASIRAKAENSVSESESLIKSLVENSLVPKKYAFYTSSVSRFEDFLTSNEIIYTDHFSIGYKGKAGGIYNFSARSVDLGSQNLNSLIESLDFYVKNSYTCTVVCRTDTEVKATVKALNESGINAFPFDEKHDSLIPGAVCVICDTYPVGYELFNSKFVLFVLSSKSEANARTSKKRRANSKNAGEKILSYADLNVGDYVVHASYGIGKYLGIENMCVMGAYRDYISIQYAGTDKLYLPVDQLDLVSKYIGASASDGEVKLSKMGGADWKRSTAKAKASAKDMAKELIDLYARRIRISGFSFAPDGIMEREFDSSFEFEETDSQLDAIEEIKKDMEKPYPMDRVLCGDVGYGKTEVAFRAAMKAIANGKQVAILVPTTILAMQHYQTAISRFAGTGVNIDMISRFRSTSQQAQILRKLRRGDIDIIIGTHKLLGGKIEFKDLGLLIIDEEQRFGVAQKEKIKTAVPDVDVLSLSATPIPRTLSMAMGGIRDMSVLDDAPNGRQTIQSYVLEYDENVINDAIRRELHRGGQVFYLFNNVEKIYDIRSRLSKSFPDAKIKVAHGQMERDEIELIWQDLVKGEIDILVSTTIIETGIDIPNANTLIIENADRMGLAQLHQIRGRVGRSHRRAYAYFTYRQGKELSEIAQKRLDAIRDFAEFGAGFKIAMRDLEIRGAGNLLGSAQHGHMEAVGYDMYVRLLNEAVLEEKGQTIEPKFETNIALSYDAFLPKNYIKSSAQRMDVYKKIAHIENEEDYADIVSEMEDRFGKLPVSAQTLVSVALVKAFAQKNRIKKVEQMHGAIRFYPEKADMGTLYLMSKADREKIKISGVGKIPFIELKTSPTDKNLTGAVELLKIYEKNSILAKQDG